MTLESLRRGAVAIRIDSEALRRGVEAKWKGVEVK